MLELDQQGTDDLIRDIDSIARAAYIWVRQQSFEQRFMGRTISSTDESALAAGFLAGLRSRLQLGDSESSLVAYVYVLMHGHRCGATKTADDLVRHQPGTFASRAGYLEGLKAARKIMDENSERYISRSRFS